MVIFAGAMLLFATLSAAVIDLSWYWTNNLRMQRAADAAALAGVVWLPGNPAQAIATARAEAVKNGYTNGVGGFTVTPVPDPANDRRLLVNITGPIGTYFARVVGITSFRASRDAKADFVLPVPMGSPQQWYGVGNYEVFSPGPPRVTGPNRPTGTSGTTWTNPTRAYTYNAPGATAYATNATGASQQYTTFGLSVPGTDTIDGIDVRVRGNSTDPDGCRIAIALSWNNGANWTTERNAVLTGSDPASPYVSLGSTTELWGRTWTPGDFATGQFRVRVRDDDPDPGSNAICTDSATSSLDSFDVTVYSTGAKVAPVGPTALPTPPGETVAPTSQGFWGAIFTRGGVRRNGDRFAPTSFDPGVANVEYDAGGYDYTIEFKPGASNGRVFLFDAPFCAVGANASGSWYGAGDHWTTQASSGSTPNPGGPVTTEYTLYSDALGTPFDLTDDVVVTTLSEAGQLQADRSGWVGSPAVGGGAGIADCSTNPRHNAWHQIASNLPAGRYRLNVNTSQAGNANTGAENLWSIYVGADGGAGLARVYGDGRMVGYNNITSTTGYQRFYLAQIDAVHAGKTLVIELFDPGDVGSNSWLRVLSPDGNTYSYATFNYTADGVCVNGNSDSCSGTNRTAIQTYGGGGSSFDNSVLTINIPLPATYGQAGLTPAGETEAGWWKIEYQVGQANDTTTWQVSLRGNPVHLVLP